MKKTLTILLLLVSLLSFGQSKYYIATDGNDSTGDGSISSPWATLQQAINNVTTAGDTIFMRGGTYYSTAITTYDPTDSKGVNGTWANPVVITGYPGEWPIIDCINHVDTYGMHNGYYNKGISILYAEHLVFQNFELRNVFQLDSVCAGAIASNYSRNLTFEHIIMHEIGCRGFEINGGASLSRYEDKIAKGEEATYPYWDDSYIDTTRFINCDVYNLCDSLASCPTCEVGNAADAWKTVHYRGNYVYHEGCRAWNYTDDGWNTSHINGAERVWIDCWAMASFKYRDYVVDQGGWYGMETNGFKIEGGRFEEGEPDITVMINCLAIYNKGAGFINLYGGEVQVPNNSKMFNNTGVYNDVNFSGSRSVDIFRNNIAFGATSDHPGTGLPYNVAVVDSGMIESHNTWDIGGTTTHYAVQTDTITVTYEDFVGLTGDYETDSLSLVSKFTAARNSDGSLPNFPLPLASTSDLIDAGTQALESDSLSDALTYLQGYDSLDYNGSAPDIGAYEYDSGAGDPVNPTVSTNVVTQVTKNTASCGGNVTDNGGASVTARGVCYNTTGTPTTGDDYTTDGTGDGVFTSSLTGLTEGTTYYVRAYATNEAGTAYGSQVSFETPSYLPLKVLGKIVIYDGKVIKWQL